MVIKNMANRTTQSRLYPYSEPSLDVIVILLGPKTTAAIIIPGPSERKIRFKAVKKPEFASDPVTVFCSSIFIK